jgi:hypothetical protein
MHRPFAHVPRAMPVAQGQSPSVLHVKARQSAGWTAWESPWTQTSHTAMSLDAVCSTNAAFAPAGRLAEGFASTRLPSAHDAPLQLASKERPSVSVRCTSWGLVHPSRTTAPRRPAQPERAKGLATMATAYQSWAKRGLRVLARVRSI